MITKTIFKKAKYYYNSGSIHTISKKPSRIIMEVRDEEETHSVIVESKGYLSLNCDCKYGSVKSKYNVLCSHSLAVLLELTRLMTNENKELLKVKK